VAERQRQGRNREDFGLINLPRHHGEADRILNEVKGRAEPVRLWRMAIYGLIVAVGYRLLRRPAIRNRGHRPRTDNAI